MIQKLFNKTVVALVLFFILFPSGLKAAIFEGGDNPEQTGITELKTAIGKTGIAKTGNIGDLVLKYVNFSLPLLALAAFVGFVYAGFLYVTAYGSEDMLGKAKKIFIYSILGLVLVILSYSIIQLFTVDLSTGIN